ncbi:hypothetical protein KAH43_00035 [Candidatus Bipolaricaulota bacterium]|nr:hypothetical protein [Candidatus Bipolaricaulota bacterium]
MSKGGPIRNDGGYEIRCIDIPASIGYGKSIEQAVTVAPGVMTADVRVLADLDLRLLGRSLRRHTQHEGSL